MKTMRPTRAQWLEIATAFDTPHPDRSREQWKTLGCEDGRLEIWGICEVLAWRGWHEDIIELLREEYYGYWWPCDYEGDQQRAFFCCFVAVLTEKDFRELVTP